MGASVRIPKDLKIAPGFDLIHFNPTLSSPASLDTLFLIDLRAVAVGPCEVLEMESTLLLLSATLTLDLGDLTRQLRASELGFSRRLRVLSIPFPRSSFENEGECLGPLPDFLRDRRKLFSLVSDVVARFSRK